MNRAGRRRACLADSLSAVMSHNDDTLQANVGVYISRFIARILNVAQLLRWVVTCGSDTYRQR
jgi:hypothetical protein